MEPSRQVQVFTPEVVDERGNKVVGPELEKVTGLVTEFAQLAQLARMRKSLEREHVQGKVDERTLSATDHLQYIDTVNDHPHVPWATAFFANDGPDPVYIVVNGDIMEGVPPLNKNDSDNFNFTKADRRIEIVYYWCDAGKSASVRVRAKY